MVFLLLIATIISIFAFIVYKKHLKNVNYWSRLGIKGPRPVPIFGNILAVLRAKYDITWFKKYGKSGIYGLFEFDTPVLSVCNYQNAHKILVKHFESFDRLKVDYPQEMVDVVGFLNTDTTRWKHLRTKALVFFTTRRIRAIYDDVIDKCSANLVKHLDKTIGYGQPFKLKAEWARYGMDIFLGYAFTLDGHMGNYTDPRQQQQYRELVASGIRLDDDLKWRELIVRLPGFSQRLASWYTGTDLNKSFKQMEKVISAYIVQRLDNRKEGEDVGAADDDDGDNNPNKYDDEKLDIVGLYLKLIIGKVSSSDPIAIRVMTYYVIGNFLALFGSTADILTNISMHLARHPSIQKKLYAEIVEALDKGKDGKDQDVEVEGVRQCNLSFDQLTHLPYMDAVVKESLRISPSAPRFRRVFGGSRDSEAAKILPGIQLEPGTRIDIQISAIHMDDELFPDPYEYNPDRFLTTNANNRLSNLDANSLLTFSLGPQMCCGVRLAFLIVKSFLSHMIYNYQFNVIDIDDLNRPKLCDAPDIPHKIHEYQCCLEPRVKK